METAFGWVGAIIDFFGSFIPRLVIVKATHGGVAFDCGHKIRKLPPGLHFYIPLISEVIVWPTKRQTTNLSVQTLVTSDNRVIAAGGIIVYEIPDVVSFLTTTYDGEDTIKDYALSAIKRVICSTSFDDLRAETSVDNKLTRVLRRDLNRFGVKVIKVTLSDMAPCIVLASWNGDTAKTIQV